MSGFDKQRSKRDDLSAITAIDELEDRRLGILINARVDALERLRCKVSAHSNQGQGQGGDVHSGSHQRRQHGSVLTTIIAGGLRLKTG